MLERGDEREGSKQPKERREGKGERAEFTFTQVLASNKYSTFWKVLSVLSTSPWSGWSIRVRFRTAKMSRGILVIRCTGRRRKDWMLRL